MQHNREDTFSGLIDLWAHANVKVRFADNGDDRRISDVQLLSRASVKRKSRPRPNENHIVNLTPLRFW